MRRSCLTALLGGVLVAGTLAGALAKNVTPNAQQAAKEPCDRAKSLLGLGEAYTKAGDEDKAIEAFRTVISGSATCRRQAAEAQVHIGEIFQGRKMCPEAAATFEAVVAKYHDQPDLCVAALGKMGRTYKASGKLSEALSSFRRIVDGYPTQPRAAADAMLARADIFEDAHNYRKSEAECRKLIERFAGDLAMRASCREARFRIPCLWKAAGQLDEARADFAKITPDPGDSYAALALLKRGQIFAQQSKHDEAILEFKELIDKYPQHKNAWLQAQFEMADSMMAKSDYAGARRVAEDVSRGEGIAAYPTLYHDLMSLQYRCKDEGWRVSARKYLDALSRSKDRGASDFASIEIANEYEHDDLRTERLAAEFLVKHPAHDLAAEAAYRRAMCILNRGDEVTALEAFDSTAAVYGQNPAGRLYVNAALERASRILAGRGRFSEALDRLNRMVAPDPAGRALKLERIGDLHVRQGDLPEAARAYRLETGTGAGPSIVGRAWLRLGDCYYDMGDVVAAKASMSRALETLPDGALAACARGKLYVWGREETRP